MNQNINSKKMNTITIGRDNSCDIVINDNRVSRVHAEVEFVIGSEITHYLFLDRSSNGTFVNGKYIRNQSIVVYESFYRAGISPVEPIILLAGTIPISWTIILNAFSGKKQKNKRLMDQFIICPVCGEPKTNVKRFVLISFALFLLFGASYRTTVNICCSVCMRKSIIRNTFNLNILTANVLWLVVILPCNIVQFIRSYVPGHSRSVIKLLDS